MSLITCERCGYEAEAVERAAGGIDIRWLVALGSSVCLFARDRRAAGEPVGTRCPWLEQEIAAAHANSLLTRA
jgi:hypothetical protein